MVSEFILGQTQTTPQDQFPQALKTYTKLSIDSTEQTNPEEHNWHTQQIMNLVTQLAVKELLKSKCAQNSIFDPRRWVAWSAG